MKTKKSIEKWLHDKCATLSHKALLFTFWPSWWIYPPLLSTTCYLTPYKNVCYNNECYNNHGRFCTAGPWLLIKVYYGTGADSLRAAINHFATHSDYVPINQLDSLLTSLVTYLNQQPCSLDMSVSDNLTESADLICT